MRVLIFIFCSSVGLLSFADQTVGNGGDVILVDGEPKLLDFFESGIENLARIPSVSTVRYQYDFRSKQIRRYLGSKDSDPLPELVAAKLREIRQVDEIFAESIYISIGLFQWRFVDSELNDVQDEFAYLPISPEKIKQVAVRYRDNIFISRPLWDRMDYSNRVGLIFHEMIYALMKPEKDEQGILAQQSRVARDIVGFLFSKNVNWLERSRLWSLLKSRYPSKELMLADSSEAQLSSLNSLNIFMRNWSANSFEWGNTFSFLATKDGNEVTRYEYSANEVFNAENEYLGINWQRIKSDCADLADRLGVGTKLFHFVKFQASHKTELNVKLIPGTSGKSFVEAVSIKTPPEDHLMQAYFGSIPAENSRVCTDPIEDILRARMLDYFQVY